MAEAAQEIVEEFSLPLEFRIYPPSKIDEERLDSRLIEEELLRLREIYLEIVGGVEETSG